MLDRSYFGSILACIHVLDKENQNLIMQQILLQPNDSYRVAEEILRQLKRPDIYHDKGLGSLIAHSVKEGIEKALKPDYLYSSLGQQIAAILKESVSKN